MDYQVKYPRTIQKIKRYACVLSVWAISYLSAAAVHGLDYGIYDSRSLAMGGSGVASANTQNALFYNPALLALYDGHEEDTRNGRVYFPIVVAQVSESVSDTLDVVDDELDDQLTAAVTSFNADASPVNASNVATAGANFRDGILSVGNQDLDGEIFLGLMVSEPSDRAGGSFYFGSRAIAGGTSRVTQDDIDLLNDYISAMELAASGGNPAAAFPDLFDVDGNLVDPADTVTSSADIGSLLITEWGVAVSKEFTFWGQPVALGFTPKVMRVDVYRDDLSYSDSDYNYEEDKRSHIGMNTDVGLVVPIGDYFRVGLAAKDIIPQSYEGGNGLKVETEARSRLGLAFVQKWITLSLDMDLQTNESLGSERPSQDLSAGLEISLIPWVHFRGGYRQDMEGFREDVLSAGVGFRTGRFVADVAYAFSDDVQGAGLQLGWTF